MLQEEKESESEEEEEQTSEQSATSKTALLLTDSKDVPSAAASNKGQPAHATSTPRLDPNPCLSE